MHIQSPEALDAVRWNSEGLAPVITQDFSSGRVLMLAWMNREALASTLEQGCAVYWSRSRRRLWRKGEESGNVQRVRELRIDCDADALLLRVDQEGGVACHTGRQTCFYRRMERGDWRATDPALRPPGEMYGTGGES